jgi:hypothetical protein
MSLLADYHVILLYLDKANLFKDVAANIQCSISC